MKKINIGTVIDLEELIKTRLLIQANSGGGKSVLARSIMEQSNDVIPSIVIDIDGEYFTLKEKLGDVLVIGGQNADIPISLKSAKLLPKEIVSNNLSVVLDVSDMSTDDKALYAKYFIEALMSLTREYWKPYFIFIEEAHKLCGEQDKQSSAAAIKDLMSRGRKRGYCGILLTQRISKLHKDAAAECNNKFIGRTFLDIDLERAAKELGLTAKDEKYKLRDLVPGEFYAFGTSIQPNHVHTVKVIMPKTKVPKVGSANLQIKPKAPTQKIMDLLSKLTIALPGEVKKEIDTIAAKPSITGRTYEAEYKAEKQKNIDLLKELQFRDRSISEVKKELSKSIALMNGAIVRVENFGNGLPKREPMLFKTEPIKQEKTVHPKETPGVNMEHLDVSLGKCPMAIIQFLGSFPDRSFTKAQIGVATSYSPNSGGFNNALSELNTAQLIVREGAKIQASGNVTDFLGADFEPKTYDVHTYMSKLGKCEKEIYQVLLDSPEEEFTKEELAARTQTGYSFNSGGFNNAISTLNTLELIKRDKGAIMLNPELLELM